jgi:hypothetical protein
VFISGYVNTGNVFYLLNTQHQRYCISRRKSFTSGDIEINPGPVTKDNILQMVPRIPPMVLLQSRLADDKGLKSIDVGGAGDCFFRAVSHQLNSD